MRKLLYGFGVLVICGVIAFAITQLLTPKPQKLRVAIMDWTGFYPALAAKELGHFKKLGLDVEFVICKDNSEMNTRFTEGSVDITFGVLTDYLLMYETGVPLKFFLLSDYSISDSLIGKANIHGLADLKGKVIGIGDTNSFSELFILSLLYKAGIKENHVKFKVIPFYNVKEALDAGTIDAGHTFDPEATEAIKAGYKVIETSALIPGIITDGAAYRTDLVKDPKVLEKFISGFLEGVRESRENGEKYSESIGKVLGFKKEDVLNFINTGTPPVDLEQMYLGLTKGDDYQHIDKSLQSATDFFRQRGQIRKNITLEQVVDSSIVNALYSRTKE